MMIKNSFYSILLFFFIFSFPILSFLNSSHIAAVFCLILLIFKRNYFSYLKKIIHTKIVLVIFFCYVLMILYSSLNTAILGKNDFSMLKTIFNNVFSFIFSIFMVALYISMFNIKSNIEKHLSIALIIQSIIIISMLISPELTELIQFYIRTEEELSRMSVYDGVRGLGLSGSIAFGLSITMGLLSYIMLFWFSNYCKYSKLTKFILFFIVFIASLSAGRTAILAFIFGFFLIFLQSLNFKLFKNINKYIFISFSFFSILIYILSTSDHFSTTFERYINYAFQPVINFLDTGSFSVSSTEKLKEMYFIPNEISTVLFGDGLYTTENGYYYMNTDSGYLRFILYFGMFGSLIPYLAFIIFLVYTLRLTRKLNSNLKLFFFFIMIMTFILQFKGEVVFYNIYYMKIIFILSFYYIFIAQQINEISFSMGSE